jgi:HD-GYP domain-containing protein (c-di-GMP phosphodiesterase class II)
MLNPQSVDIRRVVFSLSDALDLVGVDDVLHGKRVGMMASQLAKLLGEDSAQVEEIYDAGLLHDCGVSSTRVHRCLVDSLDWQGSFDHCQRGYELLSDCTLLAHLSQYVLLHHWHWNAPVTALPGNVAPDPKIRRMANLLFLVDRVDALSAAHYGDRSLLHARGSIRQRILENRGTLFDPVLVDLFLDVSATEAFWLQLDGPNVQYELLDRALQPQPRDVLWPQLKQLALLFARIVDAKSPFTVEHSEGVGRLAAYLGHVAGLDGAACDRLELAGLLHDIGKLRIPDAILEKQGSLDEREREIMMSHSFETYQILKRTPGLAQIAELAAFHHERLNGHGYPFHTGAASITPEMRIIQVADVFQALAQRRPYRAPMAIPQILAELRHMVADDSLDPVIFALVESDAERCHQLAVSA